MLNYTILTDKPLVKPFVEYKSHILLNLDLFEIRNSVSYFYLNTANI